MGRDRHQLERKGLLHSKREDTELYLKKQQEQDNMISLTTNTRGNTVMEQQNFSTMSGPELVAAFNKMAESVTGKELGARTVQRFSDTQAGIKRCEMLASSIKARKEGLSATAKDDVMTTATKKTTTKKTTAKTAAAANGKDQSKIAQEFGARVNSYREKLLDVMHGSYRKMLPINTLLKAVYGNMNAENKGALGMVMKGAAATIKKNRLPYQIKKEKNAETKEISFGLYPK